MNHDTKKIALYARQLKNEGAIIYFKIYDDKDRFYLSPFAYVLDDKHKLDPEKMLASKKVYCVLKSCDLEGIFKDDRLSLKPVRSSGDIVIAEVKRN